MAGLVSHNVAYVIEGAVLAVLMAVLLDKVFEDLIHSDKVK